MKEAQRLATAPSEAPAPADTTPGSPCFPSSSDSIDSLLHINQNSHELAVATSELERANNESTELT